MSTDAPISKFHAETAVYYRDANNVLRLRKLVSGETYPPNAPLAANARARILAENTRTALDHHEWRNLLSIENVVIHLRQRGHKRLARKVRAALRRVAPNGVSRYDGNPILPKDSA